MSDELPPGVTDWLLDHAWALATGVATLVILLGGLAFFLVV